VKDEVLRIVTRDERGLKQDYIVNQVPVETRGQLGFLFINPMSISNSAAITQRSSRFYVSLTPSPQADFVIEAARLRADWSVRKLLLKED